MKRAVAAAAVVLSAGGSVAPVGAQADRDEQMSAWRYRRALHMPASETADPSFVGVTLPPELLARCQVHLGDLRLVAADGSERAYLVDRVEARVELDEWPGRLERSHQQEERFSAWVVDLEDRRRFDRILVSVAGQDFAKQVRLDVSDDGHTWNTLLAQAALFEQEWQGARLRHTTLELAAPAQARYLRLTADDRHSPPIEIQNVTAQRRQAAPEARWELSAPLRPAGRDAGKSRYRLDLPPGLPVESIRIDATQAVFSRPVQLIEEHTVEGDVRRTRRASGRLYRVQVPGLTSSGERLSLGVQRPGRGALLLEVEDGDSAPLRGLQAVVSGTVVRLLLPPPREDLTLYYGNPVTRPALYDLASLAGSLRRGTDFAAASLGDEQENPAYAPAAPLSFVAVAGAALDAPRWRTQRAFGITGRRDFYALTLDAHDLGVLRSDLGDLRIADARDRQVPYVLRRAAAQRRVALGVNRQPERRSSHAGWSRYRLHVALSGTRPVRLPLQALELDVADAFFSRRLRVLADAPAGRRRREHTLFDATVARRPGGQDGPLRIPLDGRERRELRLEIQEGDNAALDVRTVQAVVSVPQLVFQAGPGSYRLLLDNPQAAAPQYDLATLAAELRAYSAVPIEATPREQNDRFASRAGDILRGPSSGWLLWGALAFAVAGLLYLTARVIRPAPLPDPAPGGDSDAHSQG